MTLQDKINEFRNDCSLVLFDQDQSLVWGEGQFFDYWTEHSPKATKLRWEKEKVFDIKKRFATWKRNAEKWNKNYGKTNNNSSQTNLDSLNSAAREVLRGFTGDLGQGNSNEQSPGNWSYQDAS